MASWHQQHNPAGLTALWTPHATQWKCISDKPGELATCMTFDDEAQARAYAQRTGDVVLPPKESKHEA